jgi:hypothetical protein
MYFHGTHTKIHALCALTPSSTPSGQRTRVCVFRGTHNKIDALKYMRVHESWILGFSEKAGGGGAVREVSHIFYRIHYVPVLAQLWNNYIMSWHTLQFVGGKVVCRIWFKFFLCIVKATRLTLLRKLTFQTIKFRQRQDRVKLIFAISFFWGLAWRPTVGDVKEKYLFIWYR